jgi:carboxyl-terminal processing protease
MAGELHDAHTHVLSPTQAENFKQHQRASVGFSAQMIDGQAVVTRVLPDSEAARAGVEPGMTIETVDGQPLARKLEEAATKVPESSSERATRSLRLAYVFRGEADTTATVEFGKADGSRFEVTLKRTLEPLSPQVSARLLPSGNAYISFSVFYPPAAEEFQETIQKFHDTPGVIIDLRRNPGGSSDQLLAIAGNFFTDKTELATARAREKDAVRVYAATKKTNAYTGPVVVLVGEQSGSSSELFTAGMQAAGRVKVVGMRTCGCVIGTNRAVNLKGGGQVMISRVLWSTPNGRKLEGEGVIPDKLVPLTLADIRKGRDAALEEADQLLKEMSPSTAAQKNGSR